MFKPCKFKIRIIFDTTYECSFFMVRIRLINGRKRWNQLGWSFRVIPFFSSERLQVAYLVVYQFEWNSLSWMLIFNCWTRSLFFGGLFAWSFSSHSRNFHSFGYVIITGVGLQIFTIAQWGFFNVPHLLWRDILL